MNQTPVLPNYVELTRTFQKSMPNSNVAQIHGLICGTICAISGRDIDMAKLFPLAKKSKKTKTLLQQMYEASYHELSEFSFEFSLILPTDDVDINTRAESLGLWCQGFLTGLGQVPASEVSGEVNEALEDMMEISKINFGDIATNDEDETAYFELVEYVRLSILMIFHELKKDTQIMDTNETPSIH
jgi:hypothetical protein